MHAKGLGSVKVELTGLNLSRFLSLLAMNDISIKNLKKRNVRSVVFSVSVQDYNKILSLPQIVEYSVRVIEKKTFVSFLGFVCNYAGMILGMVCSFLAFFYASRWVSHVDLIGGGESHVCENGDRCLFKKENYDEFLLFIDALGIREGVRVSSINVRECERVIIATFENIAGCEITKTGTHVNINVHEATLEPEKEVNAMDLVAPENGIIKKMIVSAGRALVKAGDVVTKGQVLVKGINGHPAIASVEVKLYYHASEVYSENAVRLVETGEKITYAYIDIMGFKIGDKTPPDYAYYTKEESCKQISQNLFAPIKKVVVQYKKQEEQLVCVPIAEVQVDIEKRLMDKLAIDADVGKNETRKLITTLTELCDGVYEVDCYLEVERVLKI